jgi:hypothetical protein
MTPGPDNLPKDNGGLTEALIIASSGNGIWQDGIIYINETDLAIENLIVEEYNEEDESG